MKRLVSLALASSLCGLALAPAMIASPSTGPPDDVTDVALKEKIVDDPLPLELAELWVHCDQTFVGESDAGATVPFVFTLLRYEVMDSRVPIAAKHQHFCSLSSKMLPSAVLSSLKGGAGSVPATIV